MEVGTWDQRQRGIGRHFSMVKQFYIFLLITFLLLRFSCMHTMHSTCSQLYPLSTPSLPRSVPKPYFLSSLVNSHSYLLSSLVSSQTLSPLFPGQLSIPLFPLQFPSLPPLFPGQFSNPNSSLLWSIAQPSPPSSIPHSYFLSSLVKSSSLPISFPHSDLFVLFMSLWV